MYRGISLKCIKGNINSDHLLELEHILSKTTFKFGGKNGEDLYMDSVNISSQITTVEVTESVSCISAIPIVRERLVEFQREMADKFPCLRVGVPGTHLQLRS